MSKNLEAEKLIAAGEKHADIVETITTLCDSLDPIRLDLAWGICFHIAASQVEEKQLNDRIQCLEMKLTATVQVLESIQRDPASKEKAIAAGA